MLLRVIPTHKGTDRLQGDIKRRIKELSEELELMMEAVHRYEGTVNQVMGDGIMALFWAPLALEDHALRACYAALDMQAAIRRYAEQVGASHDVDVRIRVGVNSGKTSNCPDRVGRS
jgi:class 3 adenylate cyclase